MHKKLIAILGHTASGKTDLSIKFARKFNGEIISADSRQVYKGLDIGSGKITKKEMNNIPHHLLSVANPKRKFTVAQFQKLARKKIKEIKNRNKIPFLVGGTGFYIQSIVDEIVIPEVKPNWRLRNKLQKKSVEELYIMLKKLDSRRAKTIDSKNPVRLIRALEIILKTGKPVPAIRRPTSDELSDVGRRMNLNILQIGIKKSPKELKILIHKRLQKRLKQGMIAEVKKLRKSGLSWKRLEELGLEYRFVAQWIFCNIRSADVAKYQSPFQCPFTYQDMINKIQKESEHFAKRQMTWFKRNKNIYWVKNAKESEKLIKNFLQNKNP